MRLAILYLELAMGQPHRGIIWNAAFILNVLQPIPQRTYTSLLIQEELMGGVSRERIQVKNKSSETWVPPPMEPIRGLWDMWIISYPLGLGMC